MEIKVGKDLSGLTFWIESDTYHQPKAFGAASEYLHTNRAELTKSIDRLKGKLKLSAANDTSYISPASINFQSHLVPEWLNDMI